MHYAELKQAWGELTSPGAPFEIEEIEVRGNSIRNFKHAPPNIRAVWLSTVAFADRDYLIYDDERITRPMNSGGRPGSARARARA